MRTGLRSLLLSVVTVALLIGTGGGYGFAAEQSVALSPTTSDQPVSGSFTLSAFYEVDDGDNTLKGLGVRFHFDSTQLQFTGYTNVLQTGLILVEDNPRNDLPILDLDDDPRTDKYVTINWFSVTGNWPNATLPLELVQLGFVVDGAANGGPTPVNVSFFNSAGGYTTNSTDSTINVTITTATKIALEANPPRISSEIPSESTLTATILSGDDHVVTTGPDSTLNVFFSVTDPTFGDIRVGETNPVVAVNGVATIVIVSNVHETGGAIPCTANATGTQGNLVPGAVVVTTRLPFSIEPLGPMALLADETQEFYVAGGVAPYTWSVQGGGAIDKSTTQTEDEIVVFTAPAMETTGIVISVTDSTPIEANLSEATINVYEPVEIPDKPTVPPVVEAGSTSMAFTVAGGDGTYTWTATNSSGAIIDVQAGESYAFPAPSHGAFSGPYVVTAADGNFFSDSFVVYVPMEFIPQSMNILAGEAFDLVLAGARVAGPNPITNPAARISTVEFLDQDLNLVPPEEMGAYASFAPPLPTRFLGDSVATIILTGASATEAKRFRLRATVTGDEDLTQQNGLNVATTGWLRVFPALTYNGTVKRMDSALPIRGAHVVFKLGDAIQGEPISTGVAGGFAAQLPSPAVTGSEYDVVVWAENYLSRTDLSTAGWDLENGETIELAGALSSVSGTVKNTVEEGEPIQGALVECTSGAQTCLAYTDGDGEYDLSLPEEVEPGNDPSGTWYYETTNNTAVGCEPEDDDTGTATLTQNANAVTIVVDDGPTYTGIVTGPDYELSTTYEDGGGITTENVSFTLTSATEGWGGLNWTWTGGGVTCTGGSDLHLTKQNGGTTELLARASAPGYAAKTQEIQVNPDFVLTALGSGDDVGPEGGTLTSGQCIIDIPAGALDQTAQIDFLCDIDVGPETPFTRNSVALVKIVITGAAIDVNNPIQVTIPFDTKDVNPGDFKAGIATIYYADTADNLRNGVDVNSVPTEDIVYEDHLNGLAGFELSHTSVFGVGGGGTPVVTTGSAKPVRSKTATVTGTVNPNGLTTAYYFEYGKDTSYGKATSQTDAGSGIDDVSVSVKITQLSDDTVYHFRLVAVNNAGTAYGEDMTFKTKKDHDNCFIQTAVSGF
ncbi:MAG: hypothetical protein SWQ30_11805 [Thermodesulfobacteriota bacterium]|nr:hypothetical protein [Thermodesulfobacteriota bacterium]